MASKVTKAKERESVIKSKAKHSQEQVDLLKNYKVKEEKLSEVMKNAEINL